MLLAILELFTYVIERLALALMIIFVVICLVAGRTHGQVVIFAGEPTLAPRDCYCGQSCKCEPCECNVKAKAPEVSVKKPVKTVPSKASVKVGVSYPGDIPGTTINDLGSGTVIESDGVKSKVLTCEHTFRHPGEVFVYVGNKKVPAKVVRSDKKLDLALMEFDGSHDYAPFSKFQSTEYLTAYGYEGGAGLGEFKTRITGYYNYPDARVAGRAKQGRSGGGLFNSYGTLVGVCSAAGPNNSQESVYISYPAIEMFLYGKALPKSRAEAEVQNCADGQCPLRPR